MNENTNPETQQPTERHRREHREQRTQQHQHQHHQRRDHRLLRSVADAQQSLPLGWTMTVTEPDAEGTKDSRTRLRLMILEHPDKGFRLLPFMTVRVPRRMKTQEADVQVFDDMDLLPSNIIETSLPAALFGQGKVLEELLVQFDEFAKKQAALPPPSKRPLTQRPFEKLAAHARQAGHREQQRHQARQPQREPQPQHEHEQHRKSKRGKKRHTDRRAVFLLPLI